MLTEVPEELVNMENAQVLKYVQDLSAHDGVADELVKSVKSLGDVQVYCPEWASFRYVVVATNNIIFGAALGQNTVAYRLNDEFKEKALVTGCKLYPQLGESWVWVNPYSGDWPRTDFTYWARKSYLVARESLAT
jgi:hypothetical protein